LFSSPVGLRASPGRGAAIALRHERFIPAKSALHLSRPRATSGRGAAIIRPAWALYPGQVRAPPEPRAIVSQIAVPVRGPAMRGGPKGRCFAQR